MSTLTFLVCLLIPLCAVIVSVVAFFYNKSCLSSPSLSLLALSANIVAAAFFCHALNNFNGELNRFDECLQEKIPLLQKKLSYAVGQYVKLEGKILSKSQPQLTQTTDTLSPSQKFLNLDSLRSTTQMLLSRSQRALSFYHMLKLVLCLFFTVSSISVLVLFIIVNPWNTRAVHKSTGRRLSALPSLIACSLACSATILPLAARILLSSEELIIRSADLCISELHETGIALLNISIQLN